MWFFSTQFGSFAILLLSLLLLVIIYYKNKLQYWKHRNLQHLEPPSLVKILKRVIKPEESLALEVKQFYNVMKSRGWKHGGVYPFFEPNYLPIDLDYLKNILIKDFQYFPHRGIFYNEKTDPLSAHLFSLAGPKWRNLRTKLTPTFSSGKMKLMFQTLVECEASLQKRLQLEAEKNTPIDIKELLCCFTTDVIGSCAFGLECKTFENENSPFRLYGQKSFKRPLGRRLKRLLSETFPDLAKWANLTLVPSDVSDFFMKIVQKTVTYREQNQTDRKDFMQLLIDLKNQKDGLSLAEIAAQSFVFFIAGFETSSTAMSFALYELARNQEIQDRARKEILEVLRKYQDQLTYEAIQDMQYLSQIIDESLRKYPPGALLLRQCVQDYKVPDSEVVIQKGTTVLIPVLGIHHDPDYYPNPEKFDPDRFNAENSKNRHAFAFLPFGEGPRNCIGLRFGLMQAKVGLASLLKNFQFRVNPKTQEPLKMKPDSFILAAQGEIWLNAYKVSN